MRRPKTGPASAAFHVARVRDALPGKRRSSGAESSPRERAGAVSVAAIANIENGTVFKKDRPTTWRCINCGYVHEGTDAPKVCLACAHPQAHFEVLAENW